MSEISEKVELLGFGVANFRSFDGDGFILKHPKRINVIIGKNNSGKSNIIRAMCLLLQVKGASVSLQQFSPSLDGHRQQTLPVIVTSIVPIDHVFPSQASQLISQYREKIGNEVSVRWNLQTGKIDGSHPFAAFALDWLMNAYNALTSRSFPSSWPSERERYYPEIDVILIGKAVQAFQTLDRFVLVPVFREFRKSTESPEPGVEVFNGHNVVSKLRDMQIPSLGNERDQTVFNKIQRFVRELIGEPELLLEIPKEERILVKLHGNRLPLEHYGTGVHHLAILCGALAMHESYVVAIEEPEIHLHPELQRKFFRFIAQETTNTYYLTTHSNVFLDAREDVSVYHVRFNGSKSTVEQADTPPQARQALADMGYKASDLLQSNGIIWVEGPSDRIYLKRWLELMDGLLEEGIHYSIVFYGSWPILTHFTALDKPVEDLVQVLRVNSNAVVLADRDGHSSAAAIRECTARILEELGPDSCWVTKGREIENYLPSGLVEQALALHYGKHIPFTFTESQHLGDAIDAATAAEPKKKGPFGDKTKVARARELCRLMTNADLDVFDLRDRLFRLIGFIRKWNHLPPTSSPEVVKAATFP
jgi:hypothetical protein